MTMITAQNTFERPELERAVGGDTDTLTAIMRRYNQRLYRIARSIVGEADAEDVVQEAFVRAFSRLDQLDHPERLGAWLARIAVNEALDRKRASRPTENFEEDRHESQRHHTPPASPEEAAAQSELVGLAEQAIARLSDPLRVVFVLRDIEGLSVAETSACLGIAAQTVKTRLHRARLALRADLDRQIDSATLNVFPFAGKRCDRIVESVLTRLDRSSSSSSLPERNIR